MPRTHAKFTMPHSWSKMERFDLAQQRLQQAASLFGSTRPESANGPFPSMQPFWDKLNRGVNARGDADSVALTGADVEQSGDLDLSTLAEKSPVSTFAHLTTGVDEVDSEGFTSQDAGHIAHEQFNMT